MSGGSLFNPTFIRRQLNSTRSQTIIFLLCVTLSIVTLVALRGFGDSVDRALTRDARALIAGDIVVRSNYPFATELDDAIAALADDGRVQAARTYEFYSIVRRADEDSSVLSNLKVVEAGWPFYGQVALTSGRTLTETLQPGQVIVESALLERLGVDVGSPLRIGETVLTVVDTLISEPDRPVNFFVLGPRVLINAADLDALKLVTPASRVTYRWLLDVVDDGKTDAIAADLRKTADRDLVRVETYRTARTGVERFFTNFLYFLSIVGIFTLLLAGIGIQSSLTAFLRERHGTVAIAKTVGATARFIAFSFYLVVLILGAIGAGLGILAGFVLQWILAYLLRGFLPPDIELVISTNAVLESALLGLVVVLLFTFLPLYRLEGLRPSFIFRKEEPTIDRRLPFFMGIILILGLFVGLVIWQLGDLRTALWFASGALGLLLVAALLTEIALRLLRRLELRTLMLRQALRGLFRPRNSTRAIVVTLSTALGVLFCIFLIEQNLRASFVQSYPPEAPNVFFLDIQPDQQQAFAAALGVEAEYIPTVRAALVAVNGEPLRRDADNEEGEARGADGEGSGSPQYTLTYADRLPPDETLVQGDELFPTAAGPNPVSVLQETIDARRLAIGDRLMLRIQGIPLEATVASVRKRAAESVRPFFSFVFPSAVLVDAPQTIFTGIRLAPAEIPALQNRMVALFPNVTVIDVTATIASFVRVVERVTRVVRFFAAFSILAGLLIVISSVYATRLARIQEAAYYKVLGAKNNWVAGVFALENVLTGVLSAGLALMMAHGAGWAIITYLFELDYRFQIMASLWMVLFTVAAVTVVGMAASVGILRSRPINYLRMQAENE